MSRRGAIGGLRVAAVRDRLALRSLFVLTAITDWVPPRIRFGHWQRLLTLLAPREMLAALPKGPSDALAQDRTVPRTADARPGPRCLIVAGPMDAGGVESVVSMLALGLPRHGIRVEVVTTSAGRVAEALRSSGVTVTSCPAGELRSLVAARRPDVIQLHRPDPGLVEPLVGVGIPVVPVLHAMESYLDRRAWSLLGELIGAGHPGIAVSEEVRGFFLSRLAGADVRVVVNGVRDTGDDAPARPEARIAVGRAIGVELADQDVLVVGLQRYSDQKNAAGLVDAFVLAADRDPRLHLVLAGSPDNWLEFRRADAVRRLSAHRSRIHLLGDSDAGTVFGAGDVYVLDSFAEGGPLTAVEAVVHGLPVVLSDVGFSRQLVGSPGVLGEVVPRANADYTQRSMAAQRRRRHQSNRSDLAEAILRVTSAAGGRSELPRAFTEDAMLLGHASVLLGAARSGRPDPG